jgi:hypothetical protein
MVADLHVVPPIFQSARDVCRRPSLKKLTDGVKYMDFKVQDCNCRDPRGTCKCQYGGICRVPIIYKITRKMTNKIYIRIVQQNFKKRMVGHFQDVKELMKKGVHHSDSDSDSDSYARHFTGIWSREAAAPLPRMQ